MVDLIADYTSTFNISGHDNTIADHILKIVELAGMLPSKYYKEDESCGCGCGYEVNKWEPEDT